METALSVQDLTKRYGDALAVDGISFSVAPGEIFGLLGPNGAGKTTTVECLLGLRRPDGGAVQLLGMDHATQSTAIRARTGVQLQTTGLLPQLRTREQVALFAGLFPHPLPVDDILALVGLGDKAHAATRSLSGGQRQRLAIALALVNDPDLVFLDEPTTGLDPQARRGLWEVIRALKARGKTVMLTTHYMEEAEQLCDRVAILDRGRTIELEAPGALIRKHFQETAIEFIPQGAIDRAQLGRLPAVRQVVFENSHVALYSTDVPRTLASLFETTSAGRPGFHDLTVRQATLEDVFLKLTGRRIRE